MNIKKRNQNYFPPPHKKTKQKSNTAIRNKTKTHNN